MYIGQSPSIGNFQVCDAISTVDGQAAYTMQVSSVNVVPETANHMLVSLNGILQRPGSSFTVSGSTITFASNLVTGDVINFIHILGSVLDLGVPSDDTVAAAKISANAVTGAKLNTDVISAQTALATAPADTDEFLVSDAGVLKRIDYSLIKGGGMWGFISSTNITSGVSQVDFTTLSTDYQDFCWTIQQFHPSADDANLYIRVFTGTGGSQAVFTGGEYGNAQIGQSNSTLTTNVTGGQAYMRMSQGVGNENTEHLNSEVILYNPHDTTFFKTIRNSSALLTSTGNRATVDNTCGSFVQTTAVTGLRFYFSSGTIDSGRISMYGRKNS